MKLKTYQILCKIYITILLLLVAFLIFVMIYGLITGKFPFA